MSGPQRKTEANTNDDLTRYWRKRNYLGREISQTRKYLAALLLAQREMYCWEKALFMEKHENETKSRTRKMPSDPE